MKKIIAMACAVIDGGGNILLLKRSADKKLAPNKWFVVGAAPLGENEDFEKIALREIKDELGVEGKILGRIDEVRVNENDTEIVVHPFLANINDKNIKLNNEHTEFVWVSLDELDKFDLVRGTKEMTAKLLEEHE